MYIEHTSRPRVADLLDGNHNFIIPSYQRGYRWETKQVIELLDDLKSYCSDHKAQGDYYLQPVVVRHDHSTGKWEVMDGQQRLTTIWLLLNHLNWFNKSTRIYGLERQIHRGSHQDTAEIAIDTLDPCADIQSYYMWEAYNTIQDWFAKQGNSSIRLANEISYALTDESYYKQVRFIWYQQHADDSTTTKEAQEIENIKFFNRLNNGKINLTPAELIKALFVLASEKDKTDQISMAVSEQSFIQQWDQMEAKLQDDKFAAMLTKDYDKFGCRMDILFDFITRCDANSDSDHAYQVYQALFDYEMHRQPASYPLTPFWEAKGITNMHDAWTDIKNIFDMLCQWYNDTRYYHYVGYLVQCGQSLSKIYAHLENTRRNLKPDEKWTGSRRLKALRQMIVSMLKLDTMPIDSYLDSLEYGMDNVKRILLLFNIEAYNNTDSARFDFDKFATESWDIEHIDSRNKESLQERNAQMAWISHAASILSGLHDNDDAKALAEEMNGFVESKRGSEIVEIQNQYHDFYLRVKDIFRADASDEVDENCIGNLTLLNSSINREYKDAPFYFKRQTIIGKDKQGVNFIPLCTRNVFLKYYSDSISHSSHLDTMRWSGSDGKDYRKAIEQTIKDFTKQSHE